jgi:hypothetical protein
MSYDYIEVVFAVKEDDDDVIAVARASWELGQSAGISGVPRDYDYGYTTTKVEDFWDLRGDTSPYPNGSLAIMFLGKKSGKTLLGVGKLVDSDGDGSLTTISINTTSITFEVEAIETGLRIFTENDAAAGIKVSSFDFASPGHTALAADNSYRTVLPDGKNYPIYRLNPNNTATDTTQGATYTFGGGVDNFADAIRYKDIAKILVQKRAPRFRVSGGYREPILTTEPSINVALNGYSAAINEKFVPTVPILFTIPPHVSGIISFYIEIPVYALLSDDSTNGKLAPETWWLRTGLGGELYSLDDGVGSGGCVFMGVGVSSADWINIEWKYAP